MTSLTTFLWFDHQAEEAATYYTSVFTDGKIINIDYYGSAGPRPDGTVKTVTFEVAGNRLIALNGGPNVTFNESISLLVQCDNQGEVDHLWRQLTEGGQEGPCGWLKDRYGLSWQIAPKLLFELVADPDPVKAQAVMAAMLRMGKIETAGLQEAYDNA